MDIVGHETVVEDVGAKVGNIDMDKPDQFSPYARFFDIECNPWRPDVEHNKIFLLHTQNYFNEKLLVEKKVFLNDVLEALGFPREEKYEGKVGWIYNLDNPIGDNFIDFGLYNVNFINNLPTWIYNKHQILLDFNVDGDISEYL